ncbi:MAG: Asp-tRNA(Asn)/Glu-tRNA(Gln) amidotransferase subunit GatC [bacterium]|nr:Asp-tRNA(Asn)/Glu-tRNA(Gln) amidotransferase subunit GatC [bacterium]
MSDFDKKTLEYLAELGRIELAESEKSKLLKDLQEILNYFQELEKVDTTDVEPMSGGTFQENIFRTDETKEGKNEKLAELFPEKENDFLKIPPVFSAEGGSASGGE